MEEAMHVGLPFGVALIGISRAAAMEYSAGRQPVGKASYTNGEAA